MIVLASLFCLLFGVAPLPVETYDPPLFGVDESQLKASDSTTYRLNGSEIPADAARRLIAPQPRKIEGDSRLPDATGKLHLTVIGPDSARSQVVRDLRESPSLVPFASRLVVREYSPDHWHVARAGFVTTGQPTVYLQSGDGAVRHRQDTYTGPETLAAAIRRADPSYDPARDPDASKRVAVPGGEVLSQIPLVVWIAGGLILFVLLKRN